MRTVLLFTLLAVLTAAAPHAAAGQAADARPGVDVSIFGGAGAGPEGSLAWGLDAGIRVHDLVALKAEYSRWHPGFDAVCILVWPDAYRCDIAGSAILGGLVLGTPPNGRFRPFAEVQHPLVRLPQGAVELLERPADRSADNSAAAGRDLRAPRANWEARRADPFAAAGRHLRAAASQRLSPREQSSPIPCTTP